MSDAPEELPRTAPRPGASLWGRPPAHPRLPGRAAGQARAPSLVGNGLAVPGVRRSSSRRSTAREGLTTAHSHRNEQPRRSPASTAPFSAFTKNVTFLPRFSLSHLKSCELQAESPSTSTPQFRRARERFPRALQSPVEPSRAPAPTARNPAARTLPTRRRRSGSHAPPRQALRARRAAAGEAGGAAPGARLPSTRRSRRVSGLLRQNPFQPARRQEPCWVPAKPDPPEDLGCAAPRAAVPAEPRAAPRTSPIPGRLRSPLAQHAAPAEEAAASGPRGSSCPRHCPKATGRGGERPVPRARSRPRTGLPGVRRHQAAARAARVAGS
nr:translation initiation factor IF-2-like [Mirounga angustirostris]